MSFAKSWQEKGCSSQAETWQVKNILMKDFDWQVKCDVFVVSMATWTIEYNLKSLLLLTASSSGASFFAWQRRARNEWLVMIRKGPWEGYRRQAKRRLAHCLLPAFLCAHIFMKRETSGCETVLLSLHKIRSLDFPINFQIAYYNSSLPFETYLTKF